MQELRTCFVGVDVSKDTLVVARQDAALTQIRNSAKEIRAWLRTLPADCTVAMEATGGYQDLLAKLCHAQGCRVFVLNALDVHYYARSCAVRGKTDRVDAQIILRYVEHEHSKLRPWQPPSARALRVRELMRQRELIGRTLDMLTQGLKDSGRPAIKALRQAQCQIDRELLEMMRAEPQLRAGYERLKTIVGVGPLVGAMLADLFTERAFATADAAVAFTGLDPRPHDSGKSIGQRRLSKRGAPQLRRLLFIAAMSACRSKTFRPLYLQLRQRGLASTQAIVILARKILRIAFSIWHSGQTFNPSRLSPSCPKP